MKKILFSIILLLGCYVSKAQQINQTEEIKKQLNDQQLSEITEAEAARAKADALLEAANKQMDKVNAQKAKAASASKSEAKKIQKSLKTEEPAAVAKKITALTQSNKVNSNIYKIYQENLDELEMSAKPEKQKSLKEILALAKKDFDDAELTIKKLPTGKKVDQNVILKNRENADIKYNDAIAQQVQAYACVLGWYDIKEEEKKVEQPVVQIVQQPENTDRIIYKVQIAASETPLSMSALNEIYKTNDIINNDLEENLYRYSIGYFSTYEEAAALRDKIGVRGAFIVAYKNGKRVTDINEVYNK